MNIRLWKSKERARTPVTSQIAGTWVFSLFLNIERAKTLIEQGRMSKAGLSSFNQRVEYEGEFLDLRSQKNATLPEPIEAALKANKKAWRNFNALAPGYKKQYILWLITARKPETRARRLEEALRLLSENKKLGMK